MKKYIIYGILAILVVVLAGCKDYSIGPHNHNSTPPGKVSDVEVENRPGQVQVTYKLPTDQDLLYVKAVYTLHSGATREVKASFYTNSMILDGFRDDKEYEVALYAVNSSEVASEPIFVKVYPGKNPIWGVRNSLKINPDFLGVNVQADNPTNYNVSIEMIMQDQDGVWHNMESIHSAATKINRTERGLDTLKYYVGATVRDRFLNYTDTVFAYVTPMFEQLLDKLKFSESTMTGDATIAEPANLLGVSKIWDGDADFTRPYRLVTTASAGPQTITFNMGQTARVSRIHIWNYGADPGGARYFFYQGHMRFFQVWGSMEPDLDGGWNNWTLLGDFEVIKPSGLPSGTESNEDYQLGVAGMDFTFDFGPEVRYIRIKNLLNWEASYWFEIKELSIYGDPR